MRFFSNTTLENEVCRPKSGINLYPGGMQMPGRTYNGNDYRYGMNGQEKDDEIFNGAYSADYWEYDSRILRRWNTDPVVKPWESPYACFNGNPIYFADPKGLDGEKGEPANPNGTKGGPKQGETCTNPAGSGQSGEIFDNGQWTRDGGGLDEVVVKPNNGSILSSASTGGSGGVPTGNTPNTNPDPNKTAEGYTIMKPFVPQTVSNGEMDVNGVMHTWKEQTKNPWPSRDYLRYANWNGGVSWDASISKGPFSVNKDFTPSIGYGPLSISKNSGELLLFGWDKSTETFADIVKPNGPLLSSPTATAIYEFTYDQNRKLLMGRTNLKVHRSFVVTPGGTPIGPSQLIFDSTFNSGLATPPVGYGGASLQIK